MSDLAPDKTASPQMYLDHLREQLALYLTSGGDTTLLEQEIAALEATLDALPPVMLLTRAILSTA